MRRLGPYAIVGVIARGGAGTVFRARSPDGRDVAVKLLKAGPADRRLRFERERRLLASFTEDDGYVPLIDGGESTDGLYVVMPLIEGGTLRARLDRGALGIDETLTLGRALAKALAVAHERGIVHRDLKPENVLFTSDGKPLVADLGLAKHFDRDAPGATASACLSMSAIGIRGTAGYMAPEQMADARSVGPPADVFALGAILYECLAGRPAFQGESVLELLAHVAAGALEPLSSLREDTPAWLAKTIGRALEHEASKRFEDARRLHEALEAGPRRRARWGRVPALALSAAVGGAGLALVSKRPVSPHIERPSRTTALVAPIDTQTRIESLRRARKRVPGVLLAWTAKADARRAEELALSCGIEGIELPRELREAWRPAKRLGPLLDSVDALAGLLADEEGREAFGRLLDLDPKTDPSYLPHGEELRAHWRRISEAEGVSNTLPALVAPVLPSFALVARNKLRELSVGTPERLSVDAPRLKRLDALLGGTECLPVQLGAAFAVVHRDPEELEKWSDASAPLDLLVSAYTRWLAVFHAWEAGKWPEPRLVSSLALARDGARHAREASSGPDRRWAACVLHDCLVLEANLAPENERSARLLDAFALAEELADRSRESRDVGLLVAFLATAERWDELGGQARRLPAPLVVHELCRVSGDLVRAGRREAASTALRLARERHDGLEHSELVKEIAAAEALLGGR